MWVMVLPSEHLSADRGNLQWDMLQDFPQTDWWILEGSWLCVQVKNDAKHQRFSSAKCHPEFVGENASAKVESKTNYNDESKPKRTVSSKRICRCTASGLQKCPQNAQPRLSHQRNCPDQLYLLVIVLSESVSLNRFTAGTTLSSPTNNACYSTTYTTWSSLVPRWRKSRKRTSWPLGGPILEMWQFGTHDVLPSIFLVNISFVHTAHTV